MPNARKQAANLSVAAFVENHFEYCRLFPTGLDLHVHNLGETFRKVNALAKLSEDFRIAVACDLDLVGFFYPVPRVRELVCQFAIIGKQNQPLAGHIEPSDVEHASNFRRYEVDHPGTTRRITGSAHDAWRLVDRVVDSLRLSDDFAVDADFLVLLNAGSKLADDFTVDLNATFGDERF